ncbi:MAG: Mammalian cell entry related domain protein [Proteobacteria bacterium]|nr:Mammalian cell entry related domain protein [Pseudomonadota bacterium]
MRPMAWRVGLFALLGVALLLAAIVGSTRWFAATEAARMRFDSSVFGLQVGAPVVFRGVRVGQVTAFGLAPLGPGGVAVPVTAEFDRALLRDLLGSQPAPLPSMVAELVGRGLVARLAMQSLLTGQLYVEVDIDPTRASAAPATPGPGTLPLIPTEPTRLQTLQAQLQGLDLAQIGQDLAVLARSARQLMAGPQPERVLARTADAAQALERLAARLERELGPLSASARQTLAGTQRTLQQVGQGAVQLGDAASAVQGQVGSVAQGLVPLTAELRLTAEELTLAATTLREAAAGDSSLRLGADRALQDVSRAARALRELSETVERQPDLLLRGRAPAPATP